MKKILTIMMIILPGILFGVEGVTSTSKPTIQPTLPITKPTIPIVRPIVNRGPLYQDNNYYTTVESNCESYIEVINQKNEEIQALKREIESLQNQEQVKMQKNLKSEYEKGLQEFENRSAGIQTKSRAIVSDKPID